MKPNLVIFSLDLGSSMEHDNGAPWTAMLKLIKTTCTALDETFDFGFFGIVDELAHKPLAIYPTQSWRDVIYWLGDEYQNKYPGGIAQFDLQITGARALFEDTLKFSSQEYAHSHVIQITDGLDPVVPSSAYRFINDDGSIKPHTDDAYDFMQFDRMQIPERMHEDYGLWWHVVPVWHFNARHRWGQIQWRTLQHMTGKWDQYPRGSFIYDPRHLKPYEHWDKMGARLVTNVKEKKR